MMPSDRQSFSSPTGVSGYKTIDEADSALLSAGWRWAPDSKWAVEIDGTTDPEGWKYAVDFDSPEGSASKSKGMMHFVRWRKLQRTMHFDATLLFDSSPAGLKCLACCSYGDYEEIERVAASLLPALTAASLKAYPKSLPDVKLNELKGTLLHKFLSLGSPTPPTVPYSPDAVNSRLDAFVAEASPKGWASAMGVGGGDSSPEFAARRASDVAASFSRSERVGLAEATVRWLDPTFAYHCDGRVCGDDCAFKAASCGNEGCKAVYSSKHGPNHDSKCEHKVVPCPRSCGEGAKRGAMKTHLEKACPLRPAKCPFADLGCLAELTHAGVEKHIDEATHAHLMMALGRIREQQGMIQSLKGSIDELRSNDIERGKQMGALGAGLTAANAAVDVSQNKVLKHLSEEIARVDAKGDKKVQNMEAKIWGDVRNELGPLTRDVDKTSKSVAEITQYLQAQQNLQKKK